MSIESLKALFRPELAELTAYRVPPAAPAVKLDANESPFELPPEARARIATMLHATEMNRYPDGRATALRNALAHGLGGSADEYVLGVGSDELIALLATAMSTPRAGAECPVVVFPDPTFVMYGMTSRAHGWDPVGVPLDDDWDLDTNAMARALERRNPKIAYYATPNNPTGNCFSREKIELLVDAFRTPCTSSTKPTGRTPSSRSRHSRRSELTALSWGPCRRSASPAYASAGFASTRRSPRSSRRCASHST